MKIWAWGAVVASTIAVVACGNGGTSTTTTAGTGGSTSGTTASHVAASSTSGVTTGTGGSGGGAGACGSIKYTSVAACEAVVETNCCDELSTCDVGSACNGWVSCVNACVGMAMSCDATCKTCVQACDTNMASGKTDYDALQSCYDQKCAAAPGCGTEVCMSGILEADATCGMCLGADATCCAAFTACAADMPCTACLSNPTAATCKAGMNAKFDALNGCQNGAACGAKCADAICDSGLHYPNNPACNYCLGNTDAMNGCCEEMDACVADATCKGCLTGTITGAMCTSNMPLTKFNTCSTGKCAAACGG
jgi:hypothetical protein